MVAVNLNGKLSEENLHLNGSSSLIPTVITFSDAVLIDSTVDVNIILSSNAEANKTIGVVFKNSNIKFIPTKIFEDFPNLQVLYVDGQQLIKLEQHYFKSATSLRTLWAPNNEITELDAHTFSYMANLYTLDLSNNPIDYIHSLGFSGLSRLVILNLSGTKLKNLSFDSFWYLFQLTSLKFANDKGNENCLNKNVIKSFTEITVLNKLQNTKNE